MVIWLILGLRLTGSSFVFICAFWPLNVMEPSRERFAVPDLLGLKGMTAEVSDPPRPAVTRPGPNPSSCMLVTEENGRNEVSLVCACQADKVWCWL